MARMLLLAVLGSALTTVSAKPARSVSQGDGTITTPSKIPKVEYSPEPYEGTVTAITASSITIRRSETEAKRFALSDSLAAGNNPSDVSWDTAARPPVRVQSTIVDHERYRAGDVRVGDRVKISHSSDDGVVTCDTICILRRPGGRVPPAPGDRPDWNHRWHERMNAYQDWEEKRIPLPNKYAYSYRYGGVVIAVGEGSITIQHLGLAAKRFELSPSLAAGHTPTDPHQPDTRNPPTSGALHSLYRAADVRVGDRAVIHFGRVDGVDVCDAISIIRRPRGRIPPMPGEGSLHPILRHSEWMNALQDREEKGIRPPEKYAVDPLPIPPLPKEVIPRAKR